MEITELDLSRQSGVFYLEQGDYSQFGGTIIWGQTLDLNAAEKKGLLGHLIGWIAIQNNTDVLMNTDWRILDEFADQIACTFSYEKNIKMFRIKRPLPGFKLLGKGCDLPLSILPQSIPSKELIDTVNSPRLNSYLIENKIGVLYRNVFSVSISSKILNKYKKVIVLSSINQLKNMEL